MSKQNSNKQKRLYLRINGKYYLLANSQYHPVTDEVFRAYIRPVWTERKRKERETRCFVGGSRCTDDCSKCPLDRNGAPLSLERRERENGYTASSIEKDISEILVYKELLEKLFEELEKLTPTDQLILQLFKDGKSEREISRILKERSQVNSSIQGLSQKSVNIHKNSLFILLREKLKHYR